MRSSGWGFREFLKKHGDALRAEYGIYGSNPNVDYCVGGGCNHSHNFEHFARREYEAYVADCIRDERKDEGRSA